MKKIFSKYYLAPLQFALELTSFLLFLFNLPEHRYFKVFLPLAFHLIALVLLCYGFLSKWDYTKYTDKNYTTIALLLSAPIPFFGFFAFAIIYLLLEKKRKKEGVLLKEFEEYIAYEHFETTLKLSPLETEATIFEELELTPLREIMQGKNLELKRGAILTLSKIVKKEAIEILKMALLDEEREIRYYASHFLAEIEREYSEKIFNLRKKIEEDGNNYKLLFEYAKVCFDYATCGLLDASMKEFFLSLALNEIEEAIKMSPYLSEEFEFKGKILMEKMNFESAIKAFEEVVERGEEKYEIYLNILHCLYGLKKYKEMLNFIEKIKTKFPEKKDELKNIEEVLI